MERQELREEAARLKAEKEGTTKNIFDETDEALLDDLDLDF